MRIAGYNGEMNALLPDVPSETQSQAADFLANRTVFFSGPASNGKTTSGLIRLHNLLNQSSPNQGNILILVPQRSLAEPYFQFTETADFAAKDRVSVLTMSSLVRRMISLFWPIIASHQLFKHPYEQARFLTLETSQYYMEKIVAPMIDEGRFSNVTLPVFRLYSQIIDNLNKSALVGFPHTEIGSRLSSAWIGDTTKQNVFSDVQEAVNRFRAYCLEHNLVDYSLQVELFGTYLWPNATFQKYINNQFSHLIYDNSEEDPPYVHELVAKWLPNFETALILHDDQAGYRSFLGADPASALSLEKYVEKSLVSTDNFVSAPHLQELRSCFRNFNDSKPSKDLLNQSIFIPDEHIRFFPELLDKLVEQIKEIKSQADGKNKKIAILAPFVSDSLRFSLSHKLEEIGLPVNFQRPSSPLMQNPTIKTLVVLTKFAHPNWTLRVNFQDASAALNHSITDLDLNRSHLLLGSFDPERAYLTELPQTAPDPRVDQALYESYENLRNFLLATDPQEPLDSFLSRLFGELLSQPGYRFENKSQAGTDTAILMESFRKFRLSLDSDLQNNPDAAAKAFIQALDSGLISAMYLADWESSPSDSILIAPVLSYLMRNEAVDYQFWLSIGSKAWYERLEQPLTHPVVLSRHWQEGKQWSADDEASYNQANLQRILSGLLLRCREKIYIFSSDYNESGIEERGQLLTLFQTLYRKVLRGSNVR